MSDRDPQEITIKLGLAPRSLQSLRDRSDTLGISLAELVEQIVESECDGHAWKDQR